MGAAWQADGVNTTNSLDSALMQRYLLFDRWRQFQVKKRTRTVLELNPHSTLVSELVTIGENLIIHTGE